MKISYLVLSLFIIYSCAPGGTTKTDLEPARDVHSYAVPEEARITHLILDLSIDFQEKTLKGKALYNIEAVEGARRIIFDTRDIEIHRVTFNNDEHEAEFRLGTPDHILGAPLEISLIPRVENIAIYYTTSPSAQALQWLEAEKTADKELPFLFTQSQAILARTWIPIQDGPGIRFTYEARIQVPEGFMVLMSAENPREKIPSGLYTFNMEQPIPAYLMALAAGDLVFKPVGSRTGVYAEPSVIDAAVYEFAEMEQMLVNIEELYGPYRWGRYDVIVLPPSFPFGGMENPRLTFATPTIIAGDRSLTALIAHELAHSWSGNLVTNATWNDFWLNEGFTVYLERRIMESIHDAEYAEMLSVLGYQNLNKELQRLGENHPDTRLKLDLEERDPDEGLTYVAYEKGKFFLKNIEEIVGRDKFDAFLNQYFNDNAFQTMTTEGFIEYLRTHLIKGDQELDSRINIEGWIYSPGLPANFNPPHSERFRKVNMAITKIQEGISPFELETKEWSTHEWLHFLRHLPDNISLQKMIDLDLVFNFTRSGNSEIQAAWYLKAIQNNYEAAYPAIEEFLITVGRRKFLMPLYGEMAKTPEGLQRARKIYAKARPNYHAISQNSVDEILSHDD